MEAGSHPSSEVDGPWEKFVLGRSPPKCERSERKMWGVCERSEPAGNAFFLRSCLSRMLWAVTIRRRYAAGSLRSARYARGSLRSLGVALVK